EEAKLKAFLLGQRLPNLNRFLPERIIDINARHLHTLQRAVVLLTDIFDIVDSLPPVGRPDRENLREDIAVNRIAATDERLQKNILVVHDARQHGKRYRCREHIKDEDAFALQLLIAFDPALRLVAMILNDQLDRMAVNAALHVHQGREIAGPLNDLRGDECVRFTKIVANAEFNRVGGLRRTGG